jgi:pyruvate dehydrogenase E1 component alpha subunit
MFRGCGVEDAEAMVDLDPIQLVTPDGSPAPDARYELTLPAPTLTRLYELMAATRELDTEFVNLQRQGQLALYPSCRGQEAAQVGCAAALRDDDWLFPQYRELGVFLVRGIAPGGVGAAWRGTWHGGMGFTDRACAPMSIPIGTQALHAVGAAMAARYLAEDSVTVGFIGDGATSEGDVHEALNFAAVFAAPCLFYVQNNQWAISVPLERQLRAPSIAHKAVGYGMPGVRVDGNDVLACFAVVAEAARRARAGEGPTLIEAVTYRLGPHTTSDDPARYRTEQEVEQWAALDPLPRFERYLRRQDLWDAALEERVAARSAGLRAELRDAVFDAADLPATDVFDYVFAEPTRELLAQRGQLAGELAREA